MAWSAVTTTTVRIVARASLAQRTKNAVPASVAILTAAPGLALRGHAAFPGHAPGTVTIREPAGVRTPSAVPSARPQSTAFRSAAAESAVPTQATAAAEAAERVKRARSARAQVTVSTTGLAPRSVDILRSILARWRIPRRRSTPPSSSRVRTQWGDGIKESWLYSGADHQVREIGRHENDETVDSTTYHYYATGNLKWTSHNATVEGYVYDRVGRLKEVRASWNPEEGGDLLWSANYNGIGNLTRRDDHGAYHYDHAEAFGGPHAIAATDSGYSFLYDALGRVRSRTSPDGTAREFEYTSFDLPSRITTLAPEGEESSSLRLGYDAEQRRAWTDEQDGDVITRYAGAYREKTTRIGAAAVKSAEYSVFANGQEIARVSRLHGDDITTYFHRDRLGSVALARNSRGETQRFRYSPFGQPSEERNAFFAGHEIESGADVIDMHGRYYDAVVGRFLTPDPLVQDPFNAESLNRYSYVWNNPLNLVDPTGFETRPGPHPKPPADTENDQNLSLGYIAWAGRAKDAYLSRRESTGTTPPATTSQGESSLVSDAVDYIDRNQLVILNRVGDTVTGWGEAVSFGAGGWLQEELGLDQYVNHDSTAYQAGFWGSIISPGGWRTLLTNPRAFATATIAASRSAIALGGNAIRATVSAAARGASGAKNFVIRLVDSLPVPGIGSGGPGTVTVGSLRAAAASRAAFSAKRLASALIQSGTAQPAETVAHHIVAGGAKLADPARRVLARFKIGLDDAVNGVFLPANKAAVNPTGAAVHSTLHTNKYYAAVNKLLTQAATKDEVLDALDYIRTELQAGRLP